MFVLFCSMQEAVTPRVETGSNYSEEGSGSVSAEDRMAAELPEATLKMPESPSASSGAQLLVQDCGGHLCMLTRWVLQVGRARGLWGSEVTSDRLARRSRRRRRRRARSMGARLTAARDM